MRLREIRLQDFRNIREARLLFEGERTFFLGANGQGKTNLLEAIGYVSALRAFRPGDNRVLIRAGAPEAALAYRLEHEALGASDVVLRVRPKSKEVMFDGNPVRRLADVIGRFPTVLFASEDIQLLRGGPGARRRFLDLHLASLNREYFEDLQRFQRALEQRNRLLKEDSRQSRQQLAAFEARLAPPAVRLIEERRAGLAALGAQVEAFYARLADAAEGVSVEYRADLEVADADEFLESLERNRSRDLQLKSTQRGPHRDDLGLRLEGREAGLFASEGQQRALVLALRFAQLQDIRTRTGVAPAVLADDVLGELDPARRGRFWASLNHDVQLFATGTILAMDDDRPWQVFRVEQGRFCL